MPGSEQPHRTASTKEIRLLSSREQKCSPAQPKASSQHSITVYGGLSAAFLLGHLCRVSWPPAWLLRCLCTAPRRQQSFLWHWSEPGAENTSKGTTALLLLLLLLLLYPRGCTACTAPLHSIRDMPLKHSSAPAATPTCVSPWQDKEELSATCPQAVRTVPCGLTS